MFQPFWQRAMSSLDFTAVDEFVAEAIPENDHIEYKGATYNKQSQKLDLTDELLETIVAFANSGGGMLFFGVEEEAVTKRPNIAKGIATAQSPRDLEDALRNKCAALIEPALALETRQVAIPSGPYAGNLLLLIRVRAGRLRPYYLRGKGIYLRVGADDRLATLRQLADLFGTSLPSEGRMDAPWSQVRRNIFSREQIHKPEVAPYVMVGLTPAFPLDPLAMDEQTDESFFMLCVQLFGKPPFLVRLEQGIMHVPYRDEATRDDESEVQAFNEGSVGVAVNLHPGETNGTSGEPWTIRLFPLWRTLYHLLTCTAAWPRQTFGYDGPLLCRIALGNIANTVAGGLHQYYDPIIPAGARNTLPRWAVEREWNSTTDAHDLIEDVLASLARQLQFPNYQAIKKELRTAANH